MSIAILRHLEVRLPANIDDVSDALSDAQAEAHDAAQALSFALKALHGSECTEAASQLAIAVEALREALERASAAASPLLQWSDREQGDW